MAGPIGGPVGDVEGEKTLVVCGVECEAEIRERLARNP